MNHVAEFQLRWHIRYFIPMWPEEAQADFEAEQAWVREHLATQEERRHYWNNHPDKATCTYCWNDVPVRICYLPRISTKSTLYHVCWWCVERYLVLRQEWTSAQYLSRRKQAMPEWVDRNALKEIYLEARRLSDKTGIPHHVDHIVPLHSDVVSGLHVPWNLRVIPWYENLAKGNKFDGEKLEPVYQPQPKPKMTPRLIKRETRIGA